MSSLTSPVASGELPRPPAPDASARMRRAGQLVSERRLAEAEVEILEALGEAPDDLRAHKLLALVRFRLGRLVDARASYQKVVEAAPEDAAARLNLGLIALKLERFEEATDELAGRRPAAPEMPGRSPTSAMPRPAWAAPARRRAPSGRRGSPIWPRDRDPGQPARLPLRRAGGTGAR